MTSISPPAPLGGQVAEPPPDGLRERALDSKQIVRRPEVVCAWIEGLSPAQFELAATWAALRRCPSSQSMWQAAGHIEPGSKGRALRAALGRLEPEAPRLAQIVQASGVRPDEPGCQNLIESARTAVRAAYVSRRVVHPLAADHAIAHFVGITRAVDFAQIEGRRTFSLLCRVAQDADLPFEELASAVMASSVPIGDHAGAGSTVSLAWLPSVPTRLRHRSATGRRVMGAFVFALAVVVTAVIVVGAVTIVRDVWNSGLL